MKRSLSFAFFFAVFTVAVSASTLPGTIERFDPALDRLIAVDATIEKLADGFNWSEGPVWYQDSVVFSDVPENVAYRWSEGMEAAQVFLDPSGLTVPTAGFREPGSNGLAVDAQGRLLICQHGDRRVSRFEGGGFVTLADRYDGKRFNSPNDLVVHSSGVIYFTDPPYGLEGLNDSPLKELPFNGVFRIGTDGSVTVIIGDLTFPNGIGLSPDESTLYVGISDRNQPRVMAYDLLPDGSAGNGRVFFDALPHRRPGLRGSCDGLAVDREGNVWTTGPGGVWVVAPGGRVLGRINTGQATGNCCWGDDGSTLYITADMFLLRVRTLSRGAGWR